MFIPKKAIILAAGQGKRLLPYTKDKPKCLLPFGNTSLIEIQIRCLKLFDIHDITVVIGYEGNKVKEKLGNSVSYISNDIYHSTSSMYSLWLARDKAKEGFILLNSDVLFHPQIMGKLLTVENPNALAMDFKAKLEEEEMKVLLENGDRVAGLSKSLVKAHGENVGMLKFDTEGSMLLFSAIAALLANGHSNEMVPFGVNAIASKCFIKAIPVDDLPWIEIDFPEDYEKADKEIYPAVSKGISEVRG